jgi:1-acyl-sn-glycerol-3-phosphate acyltransferase
MNYIDIASVIKDSDSEKLKRLPGFIIRWIERIIMQERMNRILTKYADYKGLEFLPRIIEEFNLTIEVEGKENLPESGRCFFLSNHPFGIIDGLVLTKIVGDEYHELKSIGNEVFLYVPHLRPLIAAVNVFGRNSKEYVNSLENIYNSDVPITHFPAGEVSRFYSGRVQDCRWQKSFITKSVTYKRDIVPFYIYGRNSRFFYFISFLRRVLGIKSNIELMLLPREMFRKENKTIKVKIGKLIPHQKFNRTYSPWDWAGKVRSYVYDLKNNPASVF